MGPNINVPYTLEVITQNEYRVRIRWDMDIDDGYYSRIYEADTDTGPYNFIAETKEAYQSEIVTGTTIKYYKVSSVRVEDDEESALSDFLCVDFTATSGGGPSAPDDDLVYKGTWNASTNIPNLGNSGIGGVKGDYYRVTVAGNTLIDGVSDWEVGDWIVNEGTQWVKADHTDLVTSVNGETGDVVLDLDPASFEILAGENIGAHTAVVMNSAGTAVLAADSSDITDADVVVGITSTAASFGDLITVFRKGDFTNGSWSWTINQSIFFNTAGQLTQTAPTSGFSQKVGIPLSATSFRIAIGPAVILL